MIRVSSDSSSGYGVHTESRDFEIFSLIFLVLLGLFLRVIFIGRESLWIDEVMTSLRSSMPFPDMIRSIARRDHLPLYYSMMWLWSRFFGTSEAALRSFSAICGSLAVIPLYFIGRRLGPREALLIGSIAALLPTSVYFGQEAKMYSLLILLCSVSFFLFMEHIKPVLLKRSWVPLPLLITNVLLLYTHYYSYLFITGMAAVFFIHIKRDKGMIKDALSMMVRSGWPLYIPLFLSLPWWVFLLKEGYLFSLSTGGGIPLSPRAIVSVIPFLTGCYRFPTSAGYIPMAAVSLLLTISIFLAFHRKGAFWGRSRYEILISIFMFTYTISASLLISLLILNIYSPRYFLVLLPVVLFLTVVPIAGRDAGRMRKGLLIMAIFLSIPANGFLYYNVEKDDWRGAVSFVKENWRDGDVVVPVPFWERNSVHYYGPKLDVVYASDSDDLDSRIMTRERVWLIVREARNDGWTHSHMEHEYGPSSMMRDFQGLKVYLFITG